MKQSHAALKRDLRRLFRSMDFIADRYLRGRAAAGKAAERFFTFVWMSRAERLQGTARQKGWR
ncbi:MAG: hypothetical protein FJ388_04695 [Verrucomicrobia bacterium]|nr:hypothetical protein [Verrucomicrobiota bacterium]